MATTRTPSSWLPLLRSALWRGRERLGRPGLVALALAVLAGALLIAGLQRGQALEAERARLSLALQSPAAPRQEAVRAPDGAARLMATLPPVAQRPEDIARLMAAMRARGLSDARTSYRVLEPRSTGIERLEVTLESSRGYEAWRALIVDVLNRLPNAAISGASWSRGELESEQTEGRLSIVLYHRRSS